MALPPKFSAFRLTFTGANSAAPAAPGLAELPHTIELFLDYVCPFSASKSTPRIPRPKMPPNH